MSRFAQGDLPIEVETSVCPLNRRTRSADGYPSSRRSWPTVSKLKQPTPEEKAPTRWMRSHGCPPPLQRDGSATRVSPNRRYYLRSSKSLSTPITSDSISRKRPSYFKSLRTTKMSTDEKWPPRLEYSFLNILLEAINQGRIIPGRVHPTQWAPITEKLNLLAGSRKTTSQCREKYKRMKSGYQDFYDLLNNETGFGWDPVSNTVQGTEAQWQRYLSKHPKNGSFRTRGCRHYELKGLVFGKDMATGILHHASTASPPGSDDEQHLDEALTNIGLDTPGLDTPIILPTPLDESMTQSPTAPCGVMGTDDCTRSSRQQTTSRSGKRSSDGSESVSRFKRGKGEREPDPKAAFVRFADAAARRNDILLEWVHTQKPIPDVDVGESTGGGGGKFHGDPYSQCVSLLKSVVREGESKLFLKGCKALRDVFEQKSFMLMSDVDRRMWLEELDG